MNPMMPYYMSQPPSSNFQHHDNRPKPNWNNGQHMNMRPNMMPYKGPGSDVSVRPVMPVPPMCNWEPNGRNPWTMNKNWNQNRRPQIPYNKKNRFHPTRYENAPRNHFENNHQNNHNNWSQSQKPRIPRQEPEPSPETLIPGIVTNRKKRKPMSKCNPTITWNEEDAKKALQAEQDFIKSLKSPSLMIRFPDPDLSQEIVKQFHPAIGTVYFPQTSAPRYCFAYLDESADINKVVQSMEKVPFGQGFLSVEIKKAREDVSNLTPKEIDPHMLYVGNLPKTVTKVKLAEHFPGCSRIDIGHPQQLKNTRYAFIRFPTVDAAIDAYRKKRSDQFESRSLIVRFRRFNGTVGVPGETKQSHVVKTQANEQPAIESHQSTSVTHQAASISSPASESTVTSGVYSQSTSSSLDLTLVKDEPLNGYEEYNTDMKPDIGELNRTVAVKTEIKGEPRNGDYDYDQHADNEDDVDNLDDEYFCSDNFNHPDVDGDFDCESDDYDNEDNYDEVGTQKNELCSNDTFFSADMDDFLYK